MKHIKYRATLSPSRDSVNVVILEQTHIHSDFGDYSINNHNFVATNGMRLMSYQYPDSAEASYNEVYMRGTNTEKDHEPMYFTLANYQKFKQAVLEYNEAFKN